jgi:hypothetical protein
MVRDADTPLVRITKDLMVGTAGGADRQYALELVSYPCEQTDDVRVAKTREALGWARNLLSDVAMRQGGGSLTAAASQGGFTLHVEARHRLRSAQVMQAPIASFDDLDADLRSYYEQSGVELDDAKKAEIVEAENAIRTQENRSRRAELGTPQVTVGVGGLAGLKSASFYTVDYEKRVADLAEQYRVLYAYMLSFLMKAWKVAQEFPDPNDSKAKNAWGTLPKSKPLDIFQLEDAPQDAKSQLLKRLEAEFLDLTQGGEAAQAMYQNFYWSNQSPGGKAITGAKIGGKAATVLEHRAGHALGGRLVG